ncbi:MAG: amino acid adenylation domain-containing protein [Nitrospinae bacterium]|nr:amino acid adenylation domain-containing protein [Nitrospinota bacterium]
MDEKDVVMAAPGAVVFDRKLLEEKKYWLEKLIGGAEASNIRLDHPRPGQYVERTGSIYLRFPDDVAAAVARVSGGGGFLTYAILLAAVKIIVARNGSASTVIIGSPPRGFDAAPNALPIVSRVDHDASFKSYLGSLRQTLLDAYSRQRYPYASLLRDLGLDSVANKCPLFDIAVCLNEIHGQMPRARHDIMFSFGMDGGKMVGEITYNAALFEEETIQSFGGQVINLLWAGLNNPDSPISGLSAISPLEADAAIAAGLGPATEFSTSGMLHQMVEARAISAPDAPAVVHCGKVTTYARLNAVADRIASRLVRDGVGPEAVVGILAERSMEMIAAAIGVLKAGGAYLPLDPEYPDERLKHMVASSRPVALLTSGTKINLFADHPKLIGLQQILDDVGDGSENVNGSAGFDNAAYVIYTSGSTGVPKGAVNTHAGLANLAAAQSRIFGVGKDSRVFQFSSLSFDAMVSELAMTFCAGAALYIESAETVKSPADLCAILRERGMTHVTLPPSMLAAMPAEDIPSLEVIISAGESCPAGLADTWGKGRRFFNAYGLTECAVCNTIHEHSPGGRSLPIGKPMDNTEVHILDGLMRPVPAGTPGEMYIGGAGVSRGYINQEELTAERFIVHKFADGRETRLYKTGDIARRLPGGAVEYIGRGDHQVKLRGYRIELGEVEAALKRSPNVKDAAAKVVDMGEGDARLAAYVIPMDGQVDAMELRAFLKGFIPDYMVPSLVTNLEKMPLSPNGKIDRNALPAPKMERRGAEGCMYPRDRYELGLARIWERLLEISPVGVKDNFFELGGHSLLAVRLMAQVSKEFGGKLPLSTLFHNPTVESLAGTIRNAKRESDWRPLVPLRAGGDLAPLFLVHPGGGTVMCYQELARLLGEGRPVFGLQARGLEEGQAPLRTVEELADSYIASVNEQWPEGPLNILGWSFGGYVAYEMARRLAERGRDVGMVGILDAYVPSILPQSLRDMDDAGALASVLAEDINLPLATLKSMGPDEQIAFAVEMAMKTNLIPPDFGVEQARRFLNVFKVNSMAVLRYNPGPYAGRVTVFKAAELVPAAPLITDDPAMGWNTVAAGGVDAVSVPGTHQNVTRRPHVQALAQAVGARLK